MAIVLTTMTSGTDATAATTTVTASVTATGTNNPMIIVISAAALTAGIGFSSVVFNGSSQSFTSFNATQADGTSDCCIRVMYIDQPTASSGTLTITHANVSTRRNWHVFEVSGHLTTSPTTWRNTPAISNNVAATTHEATITSVVGNYPVLFMAMNNATSLPVLVPNVSSTTVLGTLGGTTLRNYTLTGTGAASITLGGTTATSTQTAVLTVDLNVALPLTIPKIMTHFRRRRSA